MSEIFNAYAKLAMEQGLISEAEEKKEKKKDLSSLEILYGVKFPNQKNILEEAHKEDIVILPAYQAINGLVENLEQRQRLMLDVATRTPGGNYQQYFYINAYQNLMNETIKTAFMLDNSNHEYLAKYADQCTEQLYKKAWIPVVIGIVAGVSALYGLLYTSNNPSSQGLKQDTTRALDKLKEIAAENPKAVEVLQPLQKALEKLLQYTNAFNEYNDQIINALLRVTGANTSDEKRQAIVQNAKELLEGSKHDKMIKDFNVFKKVCHDVADLIPTAIEYLKMSKSNESENSVLFELKKLVKEYIYSDKNVDLIKILGNLSDALVKAVNDTATSMDKLNELKQKLDALPPNFLQQETQEINSAPPKLIDTSAPKI